MVVIHLYGVTSQSAHLDGVYVGFPQELRRHVSRKTGSWRKALINQYNRGLQNSSSNPA